MKHDVRIIVIALLSVFAILFSGSLFFLTAEAAPITLTYAESGPPAGLSGAFVNIMKEEIERVTEGEVTLEIYWQGSLLSAKEILNGVKTGMVDMGYVLMSYYPNQLLVHNAFTFFPKGPTHFENILSAVDRILEARPEFAQEMSGWNQRVLYTRVFLPLALCSTKPLNSLEDFKGLKIRASSNANLKALESAGANPVSVPWNDCYMALETKTIDAVLTNYDAIQATKLFEPAKNIFTARELWLPTPIFITISNTAWNKLPKDIQEKLLEVRQPLTERFAELYKNEWDRIVKEQIEAGCSVVAASQDDVNKFANLPAWDQLRAEWVQNATKAGVEDPEGLLEAMKNIIEDEINKEISD